MRTDELTRALVEAHQTEHPADVEKGRRAVNRRLRRHQTERWGAVAAVALFVVATVWVAWERTGVDETRVSFEPAGIPLYVPGFVPEGLSLSEVVEIPALREPLVAKGAPSSLLGEALSHRIVAWTDDPNPMPDESSRIFRIGVAEHDGSVRVADFGRDDLEGALRVESSPDGMWHSIAWIDERWSATLSARNIDRATFESVLRSVVLSEGARASLDLPEAFREVFEVEMPGVENLAPMAGQFSSVLSDATATGYVQIYGSGGSFPPVMLGVGNTPSDAAWASVVTDYPSTLVVGELAGRPSYEVGWSVDDGFGPSGGSSIQDPEGEVFRLAREAVSLMWWDDDGVAFAIKGISSRDARRMAESLREVDVTEWEAFIGAAEVRSGG